MAEVLEFFKDTINLRNASFTENVHYNSLLTYTSYQFFNMAEVILSQNKQPGSNLNLPEKLKYFLKCSIDLFSNGKVNNIFLENMNLRGLQLVRCFNSNSAAITKPHRNVYAKMYPTVLVRPDGSTITIRYPEPRKIIKLPLNIWTLTEAERKARLEQRKPKQKVTYIDDIEDNFDSKKYVKYLKK